METTYQAFISYKHADIDFAAAEQVQNFLERYRLPRSLQKTLGRKQIGRIYRDKTETAATSDLNDDILTALRQSEHLIVICSRNTAASTWVDREICTFLEDHSRSNVITVLADGEPQEVIPQRLQHETKLITHADGTTETRDVRLEPLSCDLRDPKHKKEELLRLAAAILGCRYDDLRQRMKLYRMQQLTAVGAIVLAAALGFLGYAVNRTMKISKQNQTITAQAENLETQNEQIQAQNEEIQAEYLQSQQNQARSLCDTSKTLLQQGYREKALLTAMAITNESEPDEALVPEQLYALNSALYSYESNALITYYPTGLGDAENIVSGQLSPDEAYLWALDKNGNLSVLSMEDGQQAWYIQPADVKAYVESHHQLKLFTDETFDEIIKVVLLDDNRAALFLTHSIAIADFSTKELTSAFYTADRNYAGCCSASGDYAVVWNSTLGYDILGNKSDLTVYSLADGQPVLETDLPDTLNPDALFTSQGITFAVYNGSTRQLVLGLGNSYSDGEYAYDGPEGIYTVDAETGTFTRISETAPAEITFVNDHLLAVMQDHDGHYQAAVYDLEQTENCCIYEGDAFSSVPGVYESGTTCHGITTAEMTKDDTLIPEIVWWYDNRILAVNSDTMEVVIDTTTSTSVTGIYSYGGVRLLVGLTDGSVNIVIPDSTDIISVLKLDLTASGGSLFYSSVYDSILLLNDGKPILNTRASDSALTACTGTDLHSYGYCETSSGFWRIVFADSQLQVYRIGEDTPAYSFSCNVSYVSDAGLYEDTDGTMYAAYVASANGSYCISKINLTEGSKLFQTSLSEYDRLECYDSTICFTPDLSSVYILRSAGGCVRFDLTGDSAVPDDRALLATARIACPDYYDTSESFSSIHFRYLMAGDGSGLLLFDENQKLWYYDIGQQELKQLTLQDDAYSSMLAVGNAGSCIACTTESGALIVTDPVTGNQLLSLQPEKPEHCSAAFLDSDRKLLVCSSGVLSLYNLETQALLCSMDISSVVTAPSRNSDTDTGSDNYTDYILSTGKTGTWFTVECEATSGYYSSYSLFWVDDSSRFYQYAVIPDSAPVCLDGGEVILSGSGNTYYYAPFYTYAELKQRAEAILDGAELSEADRWTYFLTDQTDR